MPRYAIWSGSHTTLRLALIVCLLGLGLVGCSNDPHPQQPTAVVQPVLDGTYDSEGAKTRTDTFILRAYEVDSVHLAGSVNGWNTQHPDWELTLQPDGYTWRLIKDMADGMVTYKFVVRQDADMLWITDPDAIEIQSDGVHGDPSQWNAVRGRVFNTPAELPYTIERNKLVIYEMSLNDFSQGGSFLGAISGITSGPNLRELGINAIELMPVSVPSYNGWGYDPVLYSAPSPHFGWPHTFAMLVDTAHTNGIAVILDVVMNHMAGSNPLRQLDDFTGTYHFTTDEPNPWGLVELNWSDPATKDLILESLIHWVETYRVDGFRFDYIGGEPYSNWVWLKNELKARFPDLLLIAEDFGYPNNSVTYGYDAQWGGNHTDGWGGGGNNFNQVMITALTQRGFATRGQTSIDTGAWGYAYRNMWAVANVVGPNSNYAGSATGDGFSDVKYLESHDENRVVWSVDSNGSAGAQAIGGLRKARLGAVISMTSVGIPMLYNGQEIGSGEYRTPDPTTYKIDWVNGDTNTRDAYKHLIDLRLEHAALSSENVFFHWRDGLIDQQEFTMVYWRGETTNAGDAEIVVAANFDHQDHTWTIPFPSDGVWVRHNLAPLSVENMTVSSGQLTLTVPASTAMLWTKSNGVTSVPW